MDTAALTLFFEIAAFGLTLAVLLLYLGVQVYRQQAARQAEQCQQLREEIGLLEAERNRIARDLHDELGSYLYLAKSHVYTMQGADEADRKLAETAAAHIDHVIERMNGITKNMSPHLLQEFGLEEALVQYLSHMQASSSALLRLYYHCPQALRPESNLHLYRMAQELVSNAARHAQASVVQLRIDVSGELLLLHCRDDGLGMTATGSTGLGMYSLQRRASLMGGQVQQLATTCGGTHTCISIPLNRIRYEPGH